MSFVTLKLGLRAATIIEPARWSLKFTVNLNLRAFRKNASAVLLLLLLAAAQLFAQTQSAEYESAVVKSPPAETGNTNTPTSHTTVGSVFDRPKDSRPDVIVVPAGTELKVDVDQHKTVVPVRVGFATPIPALSQVTVEATRSYVGMPDFSSTSYPALAYVDYVEYATVTAITVAGNTYEVQTNSVTLQKGGTNSEVTFILAAPLKILR